MADKEKKEPKVHVSPSGRYTLTVSLTVEQEGYWQWSVGRVTDADDNYIAIIHRNYPHFWFVWVEDHPDGHDYLLCGEDYQGQTVIQLDTGLRRDYLPKQAKHGFGFCWVDVEYHNQKLTVEGCYWGAPFEIVEYDFSDPMNMPYTQTSRKDLIYQEDEDEDDEDIEDATEAIEDYQDGVDIIDGEKVLDSLESDAKLYRIAQDALPEYDSSDEWFATESKEFPGYYDIWYGDGDYMATIEDNLGQGSFAKNVALHIITFHPSAVIKLLDRIKSLQERVAYLEDCMYDIAGGCDDAMELAERALKKGREADDD